VYDFLAVRRFFSEKYFRRVGHSVKEPEGHFGSFISITAKTIEADKICWHFVADICSRGGQGILLPEMFLILHAALAA